jgi:hypothetical protein
MFGDKYSLCPGNELTFLIISLTEIMVSLHCRLASSSLIPLNFSASSMSALMLKEPISILLTCKNATLRQLTFYGSTYLEDLDGTPEEAEKCGSKDEVVGPLTSHDVLDDDGSVSGGECGSLGKCSGACGGSGGSGGGSGGDSRSDGVGGSRGSRSGSGGSGGGSGGDSRSDGVGGSRGCGRVGGSCGGVCIYNRYNRTYAGGGNLCNRSSACGYKVGSCSSVCDYRLGN